MFGYNPYDPVQRELASDLWIQQNVPGGLSSKLSRSTHLLRGYETFDFDWIGPLGRQLDFMMGGNPNPTGGQIMNSMAFGSGYGYQRYPGFF